MARSQSPKAEKITQGSLKTKETRETTEKITISLAPVEESTSLYDRDFCQWVTVTETLLRENRFTEVDLAHLIEEIADMGKSERQALESNLRVVLMHLLKYKYQPHRRSRSWLVTLREHRLRLHKSLKDSPSLRPYFLQIFNECYSDGRKLAADETGLSLAKFSQLPIFTPDQALDGEFFPD